MLRLPEFTYHTPTSLDEACSLLAEHGANAMVVAGGTDLFPKMKRRQMTPEHVIGLRGVRELYGVRRRPSINPSTSSGGSSGHGEDGPLRQAQDHASTSPSTSSGGTSGRGSWRIGPMAHIADLARNRRLASDYPALTTAAGYVASPPIRNAATIGGNLCVDTRCTYYDQTEHWRRSINYCLKKDGDTCWVAPGSPRCWAVSSSDTAPVLVALDATLRLVSAASERTISVADLFGTEGIDYVAGKRHDEIIADIFLPPADGRKSHYFKLRRRGAWDFPILGVAISFKLDEAQRVVDPRVVLGAVESFPVRVKAAEAVLAGQPLTDEVIEEAAALCRKPARPLDNTDLTLYYRSQMVPVHVRRVLEGMRNGQRN
ncbi:MAG: FAD binding domain-containing protein [Anaerolineae bacterium]